MIYRFRAGTALFANIPSESPIFERLFYVPGVLMVKCQHFGMPGREFAKFDSR